LIDVSINSNDKDQDEGIEDKLTGSNQLM